MRIRPFLKWAGNKYRCLDHILSILPPAQRLIEPFTGSGAVFMNTDYANYLLAEDNLDLINLFRYVQQEGLDFITDCASFFSKQNNEGSNYYQLRAQFNATTRLRERASLFLYLNRHGYNGLCRYNQKGIYNVPFGRYIKPYFPYRELLYFHQKSQKACFLHSDFRDTLAKAISGDVIYCDPPYAPLNQRSNFSSYTHKRFGEKEQVELARLAAECANRGVTVLISNHDTAFTRYHYRESDIQAFSVRRSISCQGNHRMLAQELLAIFRS